jgi:hypothetical protein
MFTTCLIGERRRVTFLKKKRVLPLFLSNWNDRFKA